MSTEQFTDNLARDSSASPIQVGSRFQTQDASGTPKTSPFTLTGGVDAISVPVNAAEFIVNPSADLHISELSSMAHYDVIAANTKESVECTKMDTIYVQGSGTLNFRFNIV